MSEETVMIQEFVDRFMAHKESMQKGLAARNNIDYIDLVVATVKALHYEDELGIDRPDPERITAIDHGDYPGSRLFVIASAGPGAGSGLPSATRFWTAIVRYGSCEGCDTLRHVTNSTSQGSPERGNELWTMCLHILQSLREVK